ncbi:MAG: hypothetical protein ACNYPG_01970 [Candidatus Porifericomitaceae bacterium WSBS_2022_MAG_OTU9]
MSRTLSGLAQVKSANMIEEIYKAFADIGYDDTRAYGWDLWNTSKKEEGYSLLQLKIYIVFSFLRLHIQKVKIYLAYQNIMGLAITLQSQ